MREPVKGTATQQDKMWDDFVPAGAFCVSVMGTHILLICPCGCGGFMNLKLVREETPNRPHPTWLWNGDRDLPTLTPSIRDLSGCKFHGFLTDGVWTFCEDSGK